MQELAIAEHFVYRVPIARMAAAQAASAGV